MDSGNSGSIHSSSGGDEEYDSRAESSISAFFNPPSQQPPPPQHHHHSHPNSAAFDPLPNYSPDHLSRPSPLPNFDTLWSNYGNSLLPSGAVFTTSSSPTVPFPPVTSENTNPQNQIINDRTVQSLQTRGVRNPKKRTRASRRAPTTVLTTDTTNFRAMVQEFTGIPAPPFTSSSSSSPFLRGRLDLFGAPSNTRSNPLVGPSPQPPYLLRPFAQKIQPPPPPILSGSNSVNYQMQNQILSFQSLLQSAAPLANSSILRLNGQDSVEIPSNDVINPTVWGGGSDGGDQSQLRSVNGNYADYSQSDTTNGKLNYEKGPENVVAGRGEGMVESWICSSDN